MKAALFVTLAGIASVGSQEAPITGPHPDAPPETEQFAFLIGEWDCATRSMGPNGQFTEGTASWAGEWVLDGWAIQDTWTSQLPNGGTFMGFNIRSFNPSTGKWDNRWLQTGNLEWKYFESQQVGETMVMIGGEGKDGFGEFIDRNTFYEIEQDSWRWKKDRSYDGGATWIEGVAQIHAVRAGG